MEACGTLREQCSPDSHSELLNPTNVGQRMDTTVSRDGSNTGTGFREHGAGSDLHVAEGHCTSQLQRSSH